jgi:restriction system protein
LAVRRASGNQKKAGNDALLQQPLSSDSAGVYPDHPVSEPKSLVSQVAELDWYQFEKLTELVYRKLGYFVRREGGAKADGGIDLLLELNGTRTAVQCKHWKGWNVGVKIVREFIGAMTVARVTRGILICTKGFTQEARSLANQQGIEIVDARGLEQLLKRADADFDPKFRALFKSKEKRCPKCEREMVIRTATKGRDVGSKFWGCSGYPQGCRYTMAV